MSPPCPDAEALVAFLGGDLQPGERRDVEEHFADCDACRSLLAELARSSLPDRFARASSADPIATGPRVGRYHLLEPVGAGGMGVVYAAYDPDLDRRIALKLLRPALHARGSEEIQHARARLLREAQAMARITHANVVAVHDVGTVDDEVFVAMEFVDGGTLRSWLAAEPRAWREVLDRFVKAGRGLAAAHAAGLVHRDFKPDNVLIGLDGRVRVADFGLARTALVTGGVDEPGAGAGPAPPTGDLTRTGAFIGTPAYMSPEQRSGQPAGAESDQFSFCLALHEALFGERPRVGVDPGGAAVPAGASRAAVGSPPRLRRILARGLAEDPATRHPSMNALLAELARDPARTRRRWTAAVAIAAVAASAGLVVPALLPDADDPPCAGSAGELDRAWNAERRAAARAAFEATGLAYAPGAWRAAERTLEAHAARWRAMRTDACEDTHVRHEQSDELLDARMACLQRTRAEMDALVALFERADDRVVENAAQALGALGNLSACEDPGSLLAVVPPADERQARSARDLRERLAAARALGQTGRYREGLELARPIVIDARALGHTPTLAAALEVLGGLEDAAGDPAAAQGTLEEAAWLAIAGRDHRTLAETCLGLLTSTARQARWTQAQSWADRVSQVHHLVGDDPWIEARRVLMVGTVRLGEGKNAEAEAEYRRAIALAAGLGTIGELVERKARINLGVALNRLERLPEALVELRRAVEVTERSAGPDHPHVALARVNLSAVLSKMGKLDEGLAEGERALAIQERALGPEHEQIASTLVMLAGKLVMVGRDEEAEAHLERAQRILVVSLGAGHPRVAEVESGLGDIEAKRGDHASAVVHYRAAVAILEAASGPDHMALGEPLARLAMALASAGEPDQALAPARRALAIHEKTLGRDNLQVASDLGAIAAALRALGRHAEAARHTARALRIHAEHAGDAFVRAGIELDHAKALWATGERARARELVASAAAVFDASGPRGASRRDELRAWRASH